MVDSTGEAVDVIIATFDARASLAICDENAFSGFECDYYINGVWITSTGYLLSEFGLTGVLIDPLIAQVPANVQAITATYDLGAGAGPQPLSTAWISHFKVTPNLSVTAEPGQKFILLELPSDVEPLIPSGDPSLGLPVTYTLQYAYEAPVGSGDDQSLKLMLAGRVTFLGQKYYVPLLPCVTDFALVPALPLPQAASPQDLQPALGDLLTAAPTAACDDQMYFFNYAPPPKTLFLPITVGGRP